MTAITLLSVLSHLCSQNHDCNSFFDYFESIMAPRSTDYTSVTTHLYLSNFFFITASFHDILKETAVITYGKTKKIYYQAQ